MDCACYFARLRDAILVAICPHYLLQVLIIMDLTNLFKSLGHVLTGPITRGLSTPYDSYEPLGGTNFRANLCVQLAREEEVQRWLKDFEKSSGLTWRKSKTYPDAGRGSNKYMVDLKCQHNTWGGSAGKVTKNNSCAATMYLVLIRQCFTKGRKSRLYYKLFKKVYGAAAGEEMLADLEKQLHLYNGKHGEVSAKMARTDDNQLVIAICTTLMKRGHSQIQQSGEMVFTSRATAQ
ncbi:uncharacterized protein LOC115591522 isoform X2 [Sparus aurata]|uniref:uncharacterized protein LOC115591522 isoform X2 n=1 Tax=Sparus aurata TaxID=8175 RepID=UPI0011C1C33F|nr:uncharacterized protein LOC115591522 isoform X2 [Sparus aurata]